jgi:hypothetical protein
MIDIRRKRLQPLVKMPTYSSKSSLQMADKRLKPVVHLHRKLKSSINSPTLQGSKKTILPTLASSTQMFKIHKTTIQKLHQKFIPFARAKILQIKTKLSPINVQETSFFDSFEVKELVELIK